MTSDSGLAALADDVAQFADERDWEQFHSLKNLSMALAVEAAEIMEILQWMSEEQSNSLPPDKKQAISEELADVLIYLIRLAQRADIDLLRAAREKLDGNREKYPADKVFGSSRKYSEY